MDAVRATGGTFSGDVTVPNLTLSSNVIKASDGGSTLTLDTSDNVTVAGNIQVGGNVIKASDGGSTITLDTSDNVTIGGDLKVGAVKASDGTAGISIADSTGRITVTETNPVITLGSNAVFPSGHVIQTVQEIDTDSWTQSQTGNDGYQDLSGGDNGLFSVSITTKVANSKILVNVSFGQFSGHNTSYGWGCNARLIRRVSSTDTNVGINSSGEGYTPAGTFSLNTDQSTYGDSARSFTFLDSPSASAGTVILYKIAVLQHGSTSTYTLTFNHNGSATTSGSQGQQGVSSSTFTAQEIAP